MAILYLILVVQIYFLCNINLTQLEYFLGYDASAVYLQALMIQEQGKLLIEDWIYTSTLTWDTPMLLAVEFMAWFDDIYLSFGVSILLSLALLCWIGLGLLQQVGASHKAKVLFFICLLTPYVSYQDAYNRIDYYGVILSIFGVYTLKTALMMALWWMFFYLDRPELRPQTTLTVKKKSFFPEKKKRISGEESGKPEENPVKTKVASKNKAGEIVVPVKVVAPIITEVTGFSSPETEKSKNESAKEEKSKKETSIDENENSKDENENSKDEKEKPKDEKEKSKDENENSKDENEKSKDENEKSEDENENSKDENEKSKDENEKSKDENEKSKDENENSKDENEKSEDENENSKDENEKSKDENEKSKDENEKSMDENEKSKDEKEKSTDEKEKSTDENENSKDENEKSSDVTQEKNGTKPGKTAPSQAKKDSTVAVKSQVAKGQEEKKQGNLRKTSSNGGEKPKETPAEEVIVVLKEHPKTYVYLLALLMSVFITAMSSGYHVLLYGILPPLVYSIFRNCRRDKWEAANIKALAFLLVCVGLSLWGKSIQTQILGMVGHDSTLGWTTIGDFWTNLGSIFQGYLQLTGALPVLKSPNLFSEEGIFFVCFLILSLGYLWAGLAKMPLHKRKQEDGAREYYTFLFCAMLVTFVFIYTTYGSPFFEVRYLIPNFIILLLFASLWLAEQLSGNNKSWRILLQLVVIPCLIVSNLVSQDFIEASKINPTLSREIIAYLADHESPVVYLAGEECIVFGQNIRVFDRNKTYIYSKTTEEFTHSGDYTYYLETAEYDGPVPLIMAQGDYDEMPDYFKSLFEKSHDFSAFLSLYECDYNALDYTAGITELEYSKDYPYTPGITLSDEGELIEGGRYLVDGSGSYVLWGPGYDAPSGVYDFTLHYEIVFARMMESEFLGVFDVTVDGGDVIATTLLDYEETSITLEDVDLTEHEGLPYDYRVAVKGGTELEIIAVEMVRKDEKSP